MSATIALGGLFHETNTYCPAVGREDFAVWRGSEIVDAFAGTATYLGGALAAAREADVRLVPLSYAEAEPGGVIDAAAYAGLAGELLSTLGATRADAIVLALHGAGVADGIDSIEVDLARRVREVAGPATPVVGAFDLHGNVTPALAAALDRIVVVREYPHIDMSDCGARAVRAAAALLAGERVTVHVERVPMLIAPIPTDQPGPRAVARACAEIAARPGVLDCAFFHGFPYADRATAGASVVVTVEGGDGDGDGRGLAARLAQEAAGAAWAARDRFVSRCLSPAEAVRAALAAETGPVVVNEASDNPGGGGRGRSIAVLRALLEAEATGACFGFLHEPAVVAMAERAGIGATIAVALGEDGDTLAADAYVRTLTDGRFALSAMGAGRRLDIGPTAGLTIGGVDVIVASQRTQIFDPEVFLLHGIDVRRRRIVAVKSAHHFRAGFADVAAEVVTADGPGLTSLRIAAFERRRTPRPIWPLDDAARYPPQATATAAAPIAP